MAKELSLAEAVRASGERSPNPSWEEIPPEEWVRSYRTNFMSGLRMAQKFVPGMKAQGWGRIINIWSVGGTQVIFLTTAPHSVR